MHVMFTYIHMHAFVHAYIDNYDIHAPYSYIQKGYMHLMPDHELMVKKCGCKSEQLTLIGASIEPDSPQETIIYSYMHVCT